MHRLILALLLLPSLAFAQSNPTADGYTIHGSTSAPSNQSAYTFWMDESTSPPTYRVYDGTQGVPIGTLNTTTHSWGISTTDVTATGSTTARTLAARAADVINVKDFGAAGDGTTDDTIAINAALTYARANYATGQKAPHLVFPQAAYRVTGPLNFTGFSRVGFEVEGGGSTIDCQFTGGTACVDGLGSRFLRVRDMTINGNCSFIPTRGLQIGRITPSGSADDHYFSSLRVQGCFSQAAVYNFGAETVLWDHPFIWNNSTGSNTYSLIQDGINHFNVTSTFVSETAPVDTAVSFNENTFLGANINNSSTSGISIYMAGAARHTFVGGYIGQGGPTAIKLDFSVGTISDPVFDIHVETTAVQQVFLISGASGPFVYGLHYRDHGTQAQAYIFKADVGVNTVALRGAELEILYLNSPVMFDQPAIYTVSGDYITGSIGSWNAPAWWSGCFTVADVKACGAYGTASIQAQITDSTTVGGDARGANAVDWQTSRVTNGARVASGQYAVVAGGTDNAATGTSSVVSGGQGNIASGQNAQAGGTFTNAAGINSYAFGAGAIANGIGSYVQGGNATDRGRYSNWVYGGGSIATTGDNQMTATMLTVTTSAALAVRLTADRGAAGSTNCINIPNGAAFNVRISLHARNFTTNGTDYDWMLPTGMLTRDANAASTAWAAGTPVILSRGTVTGAGVTAAADTTNGCLNLSFTPPTGNTDAWHITARVETVEVQ